MADEPATVPSSSSLSPLFKAALSTCVAAIALGVVYGALFAWVPLAYLATPAGALGFGYLVVAVSEAMLFDGRVRDPRVRLWLPLCAGALGFYFAWVAWIATMYGTSDAFVLIWRPLGFVHQLEMFSYSGIWQRLGWIPRTWELWSLWGTELIVFFATVHGAAEMATRRSART